jgi:DNA replication protein DnaC
LTAVPLLILDDFGMRKLPLNAAEELLEIIMRRYERANTLLTSNHPVVQIEIFNIGRFFGAREK